MDERICLQIDGLTDVGKRRENNEDAWWAGRPGAECRLMYPGPTPLSLMVSDDPVALLVSDGIGGAQAGEVASRMTVLLTVDGIRRANGAFRTSAGARTALLRAMREAHHSILAKSDEQGFEGMGATLSALCFTGDRQACWAQAGDSRIYVLRQGTLRQISRDHSPVGRMKQHGRITEAEARIHPARNQIDLSMGDRLNPFEPDVGVESVEEGDIFLLCSDGLSDGLWDHEIKQLLQEIRTPTDVRPVVKRLVDGAKEASGRDNITVVAALVTMQRKPASWWRRWLR